MSSSIQPPPLPGDIVAQYKAHRNIGHWRERDVYRAQRHDDESAPEIALKSFIWEDDTRRHQRFRREFLSLQAIDHPNIVRYMILVYKTTIWHDGTCSRTGSQSIKQWEEAPGDIFTNLEFFAIFVAHSTMCISAEWFTRSQTLQCTHHKMVSQINGFWCCKSTWSIPLRINHNGTTGRNRRVYGTWAYHGW